MAPSYVVPAALAAVILVTPAALTLITAPDGSKAKLSGAAIVEPEVVQLELSSSVMKASLNFWLRNSGNSSDRNRKSRDRQFAPAGTARSIFKMVTSKAVSPRPGTKPPPSCTPLWVEEFGWSASRGSPFVRMTYGTLSAGSGNGSVGNPASGVVESALGGCATDVGTVTKLAPTTSSGSWEIARASSSAFDVGVMTAAASEATNPTSKSASSG